MAITNQPDGSLFDRRPRGPVAFVLEGGGSLAATQVGMLRALTEAGISPDFVVGTSAGAINAVAFAQRPTLDGIDRLEALWQALRRKDIARVSFPDVARGLLGRRQWLVSDASLRRLLRAEFATRRLEDSDLPVYVVTTELASGQAHLLSAGDAVEALMASAAIPGLYPPVTVDGRQLVDGGVAANTPVREAELLGATDIYVLPAARGPVTDRSSSALQIALGGLSSLLHADAHAMAPCARVYTAPGPTSPTANILNFRHTGQLMAHGYQLTHEWLTQFERLAPAAA